MNRFTRRGVTLVALVIVPPVGATPMFLASATDAPNGAAVTPYTSSPNLSDRMFAMPYAGSARHGCGDDGDLVSGVTDTPISAAVPEPARLTMMGLGFAALVARQAR